VLTIREKIYIQAIQSVTPRGMVVHFGLSISSVLLAQLKQLQALVKSLHNNFNQAFDCETLALIFGNLQWFFQPVFRLV